MVNHFKNYYKIGTFTFIKFKKACMKWPVIFVRHLPEQRLLGTSRQILQENMENSERNNKRILVATQDFLGGKRKMQNMHGKDTENAERCGKCKSVVMRIMWEIQKKADRNSYP
jgi:hypothetical protein